MLVALRDEEGTGAHNRSCSHSTLVVFAPQGPDELAAKGSAGNTGVGGSGQDFLREARARAQVTPIMYHNLLKYTRHSRP